MKKKSPGQDAVARNKEAWNASAKHHVASQPWRNLLAAVRNPGFSCLDATLTSLLCRVGIQGKDVVQLGCNNGRECLSLLGLGAKSVVGIDQATEFLGQAEELASVSPHNPRFIEADVYVLPPDLRGQFDMALITIGVLNWMPDIGQFFACVARTLRSGGALVIYETHPFLEMFAPQSNDPFRLAESYFRTQPFVDDRAIVYEGQGQPIGKPSFWYVHRLSAILSGVMSAGLTIAHFEEYAHSNREETYKVYERQLAQLPMCYTLTAIRA